MPYRQTNSPSAQNTLRIKRDGSIWGYLSLIKTRFDPKIRVVIALLLMVLVAFLSSAGASAATRTSTLLPANQAKAFAYYKALRACMAVSGGIYERYSPNLGTVSKPDNITQEGAINYKWFADGTLIRINVGVVNETRQDSTGGLACGGSEGATWISQAATLWGYTSGPQLLCDLGFKRETSLPCTDTPAGVTSDFVAQSDDVERLDKLWTDTLGNGSVGIGSITPTGGAYRLFLDTLLSPSGCSATSVTSGGDYSIRVYNETTKTWETKRYVAGDRDRGTGYEATVWDQTTMKCQEIADKINSPDDAPIQGYSAWRQDHPDQTDTLGLDDAACERSGECPTDTTSCAIDGIGFLVCPVVTFLAGLADQMFKILADNFLKVGTGVVNTDPSQGATTTYAAWQVMRTVANVVLVIIFLITIFSQLTGFGISNYGVKKTLPRLVIVAILINISFFVCQIAVDLSNIFGYGIRGFFDEIAAQASSAGGSGQAFLTSQGNILGGTNGLANVAGGLLAVAAIGTTAFFLLSMLGTVLLAVLLALIMILLILVGRQAIIVLCIVVAPIAIALYLLPNTENLAKQWGKIFANMLLLFPIIALLFGGSTLASVILRDSFGSVVDGNDNVNWFGQIVAAAVQVVPLIATPLVLKGALSAVPAIGKFASGLAGRATGNVGKKLGESYQSSTFGRGRAIRKQALNNYRAEKFAKGLQQEGRRGVLNNIAAGGLSSLGIFAGQKAQKDALKRAAQGTAASAQSEAVKQEVALLKQKLGTDSDGIARHIETEYGRMNETQMEAATDLLLESGGVKQYRKVIGNAAIMQRHAYSLVQSGRRNEGEVRKKAADIANWMGTADAPKAVEGYGGDTATSFIKGAYANAEAAKLITMDPDTAQRAMGVISQEQAQLALKDASFGSAKQGTQDVLQRIAAGMGTASGPIPKPPI